MRAPAEVVLVVSGPTFAQAAPSAPPRVPSAIERLRAPPMAATAPSVPSFVPVPDEKPRDRRRARVVLTVCAAGLLVAAAIGGAFLLRGAERTDARYVGLYLTDLPSGFTSVTVEISAASVGKTPLKVVAPQFEISAHVGPEASGLIAEGRVPNGVGGDGILILGAAHGIRDGAAVDISVHERVIKIRDLVPKDSDQRTIGVLDIALDQSLQPDPTDATRFILRPVVKAAYTYTTVTDGDGLTRDERKKLIDLPQLASSQIDVSSLAALPAEILRALCDARKLAGEDCAPPPTCGVAGLAACDATASSCPVLGCPTTPTTTTTAPASSSPASSSAAPAPPGNRAPNAPAIGFPADASTPAGLRPELTWTVSDPDGAAGLQSRVMWGLSVASLSEKCAWATDSKCKLGEPDALTKGTTYYWRVDVKDAALTTTGPVWSFTAANAPPTGTTSQSPVNGAQSVVYPVKLTWSGATDPDTSGTLTYTVNYGRVGDGVVSTCFPEQPSTLTECYPAGIVPSQDYWWTVVVSDPLGGMSSLQTFTFRGAQQLPQ